MNVRQVPVNSEADSPPGATNAYVLGREAALLIDPPTTHPELDAVLADRDLAHVAVTHHHSDHVGAVAEYVRSHGATAWARIGRERSFEEATGIAPDRTFVEGTTIPTGDGPVTVLDTPGHAPEHVAFAHADRSERGTDGNVDGGNAADSRAGGGTVNGVVVGDVAVRRGSVAVAAPEGDVRAYLTSLRRLYACDPGRLYPGHGPTIDAPRRTLERLVRHRLRRERRILSAVRDGARTVEAILSVAYDKDLSGVRGMAAATVRAHLEKLAVEGKLVRDGDRVEPVV